MKLLVGLFFVVIALILLGVLLISRDVFENKPRNSAENYWALGLALDVVGLFCFGVYMVTISDFNRPTLLGTCANTAMLAAYIIQAVNIRALRKDVSPQSKKMVFVVVGLIAIAWYVGGHYTTPEQRTFGIALVTTVILTWQILEIRFGKTKLWDIEPIRALFYLVLLEFCLTSIRMVMFSGMSPLVQVEQVPMLVLVALWLQMGLKVLTYALIKGYWQNINAQEKARIHVENTQFRILNARQEKLIADLGRLNKAATAGVLTASVAHELNQPLQASSLNVEMLQQMLTEQPADVDAALGLLKHQQEDLARMASIVSTMRGVFSESGAKPHPIDLFALCKNLDLLVNAQTNKRGIRIEYIHEGDTQIQARASELQQVALNLMGNAFDALIAHQTKDPCVRISVRRLDAQVVWTVEDNGPGIAPDLQPEVFNILKTTKSEGMGLGLWLARYITERNGGHITAGHSELGGAQFTLSFPAV